MTTVSSIARSAPTVTAPVAESATLAINGEARRRLAAGERILHLGFGEAGLPVAPELVGRLAAAAAANDYRPSAGGQPLLSAAAGYLRRRRLPTEAHQIVVGPGSKPLLFAVMRVIEGDVVLAAPAWVSYAAQAALVGRRVHSISIGATCGGMPEPEALRATVRAARAAGGNPRLLIVTLPDNPTGTTAGRDQIAEICTVCVEEGLVILSDEIYRDLAERPDDLISPAELLPEQTIITSGLSKNLALGGWRLGFARFPDSDLGRAARRAVVGVASEVWSSVAAPIEEVAAWALDEPEPIRERIAASRRLHLSVSRSFHDTLTAAGIACRRPDAAFYLYPELSSLRVPLARRGITDDVALADHLLAHHAIATLPGSAFGDDPRALRLRLSTSLVYGSGPAQQERALASTNPSEMAHIVAARARLAAAIEALR